MLETERLVLDKAKFSDWKAMYRNVWSRPESARYMLWKVAASEEEAKARIMKTIAFQKEHEAYLVYEKAGGQAIGFAGVKQTAPYVYQETGICLGPDYVGKGFGKEILQRLLRHCREEHGAREFIYSTRAENAASNHLALSLGFTRIASEPKTDPRDGGNYTLLTYSLTL
ncbi:MAG: GNAT family N-acetyltransferase [Oscillospiraceae bacterium]